MNPLLAPEERPSHRYPLPGEYAERLLRRSGCTGAMLLGWRAGAGPRCRMCGTVAVIPSARLWEEIADWRAPDPDYAMRSHVRQVLADQEAGTVIMSAGSVLLAAP